MKKKTPKLTPKQKAFADTLLNNPKLSPTKAALETYGQEDKPPTYGTAALIAHNNLNNSAVQLYMDQHIDKAKNRIVQLVDSEKEEIALRASDSILDRALGKATQKVETHSTTVNLSLSLKDVVQTNEA